MKILAASDIHGDEGDENLVDKLIERGKESEVDLVVLCGDLSIGGSETKGIIGPLKEELEKPILLIPGNHEDNNMIDSIVEEYSPGVYNIHKGAFQVYDIGFFGCGGSNIGPFMVDDIETLTALEKSFENVKDSRRNVMITHSPPKETRLDDLWTHVGSQGVREAIEKTEPDVCLCGHIHETFEMQDKVKDTKVVNVGKEGTVVNILPPEEE